MSDPASKPQLAALDVDGTLLDPETQTISPAVRDAVRRIADSCRSSTVPTDVVISDMELSAVDVERLAGDAGRAG